MTSFDPTNVDRLNEALLPGLVARYDEMGERESGAYNFYKQRIEKRNLIAQYEIAIAQALIERGVAAGGVHEIGAGFGQLPFLLALNGVPAAAIETDARRAATGAVLAAAFRAAFPKAADCRFITGNFPLPDHILAPGGATALTTNLVYTTPHEQRLAVLHAMRRYPTVVVDADRLFDKHEDEAGREKSLALIREAGFSSIDSFLDLGASGRYYRLSP